MFGASSSAFEFQAPPLSGGGDGGGETPSKKAGGGLAIVSGSNLGVAAHCGGARGEGDGSKKKKPVVAHCGGARGEGDGSKKKKLIIVF